jgi:hypothetical protein
LLEQYNKGKISLVRKAKGRFILNYDKTKGIIEEIKKELMDRQDRVDLKIHTSVGKIFLLALICGNINSMIF